MKDPGDGAAMAESPLGQHLVKIIGNVCFSLFAFSVLVFTVVAVTYQPADPWFDSPKALLSRSFSQTLANSTLPMDNTVLTTGEDDPRSQSSSPPPLLSNAISTLDCNATDGDPPLNCSSPAALDAIRRYHAKNFRSLVFISYETPVEGSLPGRCEVGWWFRNRREKSRRRYKDYRWFVLSPAENCALKVVQAGRYRSAVVAGRKTKIIKPEINDSIPIINSEAEFKKGRYLYYSRGGDYCKGMNHYLWSLLCGLGEAQFLNRTFVMDLEICLDSSQNSTRDFRMYFDFEHLKESVSIVEQGDFLRDWRKWRKRIGAKKVGNYKVTPMQLKKEQSTVIWRQFPGKEPENYWYRVCEGGAANVVDRPWQAIWKSKRLMNIVAEIAGKMDWDFDAVHVIRGEKAMNKELWPNLDMDTSPEQLLSKLNKVLQPWRKLYIATNEPFYNYFDKLRSNFKVHLLDDFKDLWGNQSEWYNQTRELLAGREPEFDAHMRVAVDTEVFYRAKTRVETFNNLTADCRNGVHTC
ncbi:calcium ion binding protein [Wolffia australiana]